MGIVTSLQQIQKKCREQNRDLYMFLIDLTKAFDSVNRLGLWQVLRKIGYPEKFVKIIQSFHDGMQGQVIDDGEVSGLFDIASGTVKMFDARSYLWLYTCKNIIADTNRQSNMHIIACGIIYHQSWRIGPSLGQTEK